MCFGQIKVSDKSNEITAIPKLLKLIYIEGATVTTHAMGT
jgi:predicted transposase YbfD/YdcC